MVPDSAATAFSMYSGVKTNFFTMGYDSSIQVCQQVIIENISSSETYLLHRFVLKLDLSLLLVGLNIKQNWSTVKEFKRFVALLLLTTWNKILIIRPKLFLFVSALHLQNFLFQHSKSRRFDISNNNRNMSWVKFPEIF